MQRASSWALFGLLAVPCGCSSPQPIPEAPQNRFAANAAQAKSDSEAADTRLKAAALRRQIALSERKLEKARMEIELSRAQSGRAIDAAEREVGITQMKLAHLTEHKLQNRTGQAELQLQRSRDNALEAEEELKQIELMYKDQDLDDKTAEFVVARGRRNAERTKEALKIQERELKALKEVELPLEMRSLELELQQKTSALDRARQEAQSGAFGKEIEVQAIESELIGQREELTALEKKGAQQ